MNQKHVKLNRMEELRKIQKVEPRPTLRAEILNELKERSFQNDTPTYLKWIAAAVVIINLVVVTNYMGAQDSSEDTSYQLFSTENIINYEQ